MHAAIVISIACGLLLAGWYQKSKSGWLSPTSFWVFVSFLIIVIPLPFISLGQVSILAVAWIALSALFFSGGGSLARWKKNTAQSGRQEANLPGIALLIVIGSLIGVISLFIQFSILGYSPADILFTKKFFTVQQELRQWHKTAPSFVAALSSGFYLAAMFGGFYYVARTGIRWRYLALVPFIPAVATAYFVTTKLSFLFPLSFWIGSFLAAHVYFEREISRKTLIKGMWLTLAVGLWMLALIVVRWMSYTPTPGTEWQVFGGGAGFGKYFLTMVAGHLVAFSHWLPLYIQNIPAELGWGKYTFAGVYNYFGYAARVSPADVPIFSAAQSDASNIYTIFRQLILDFGLLGSLALLTGFGFFAEYSFARLKQGCLSWLPLLSIFYWITLWMFNTSIFNYNSIILAAFLFTCYFALLPHLNKLLANREKK
jgi:hypothetical protein